MNQSAYYPTHIRILLTTLFAFGFGLIFFATALADTYSNQTPSSFIIAKPAVAPSAAVISQSITHTTIADFNPGNFYLTGMTMNAQGGGDGNGEVRLLTVGISSEDWKSSSSGFTPKLFGHAAAQRNGIIYVSGGKTDPAGDPLANIYTTTIKSDHTLDIWRPSNTPLPQPLAFHGMVIVTDTLIVVGGYDVGGNAVDTVYTSKINSNGTLSPFQTGASLPEGRNDFGIAVISGTIYVIGGVTPSAQASNNVFYTTPDPVSGAITQWFTTTMNTPTLLAKLTAGAYNGKLYPIGGTDASTFFPYVYYAQPSADRNIVSPNFTSTLQLGQNLVFASSATFGGQIHAIGGATNNNTSGHNIIFSALISTTGELYNPVTIGSWQQSPVLSSGRIRAASVMSNDGWLYVLGGLTGSSQSPGDSLGSYDYGPTSGDHPSNYAPYGTYTSPIIDVGGLYTVTNISWNTTITTSQGMSLTLQYYCGNSPILMTLCSAPPAGAVNGIRQVNQVPVDQKARYWQYVVNFTRGSDTKQSPVLNWVRVDYQIPAYPDFAVTGMVVPTAPITASRIITFYVSDKEAPSAPVRRQSTSPTLRTTTTQPRSLKVPPPPTTGSSRTAAPQESPPDYLFYITFYRDRQISPTGPNDLDNAMDCIDANPLHNSIPGGPYPPFIYYKLELGKTPNPFYAQCNNVPPDATKFYVQIDTCDLSSDPYCTPNGYVLEKEETSNPPIFTSNIYGPVNPQTPGSGGVFLPLIRKSP